MMLPRFPDTGLLPLIHKGTEHRDEKRDDAETITQ